MVRVTKRTYNPQTGKHEYNVIGEAKSYKDALEKFNGVQGWWQKKEHSFFIGDMWSNEVCFMEKC